jgi:hypothetical protein
VQWLRVLADTWVNADVPEAKADLPHAIYDRIVVNGRSIVGVRLTPAAYSNGPRSASGCHGAPGGHPAHGNNKMDRRAASPAGGPTATDGPRSVCRGP